MKEISRRSFLKMLGAGSAGAAMAACSNKKEESEVSVSGSITGSMEYRTNPNTGDKVSLLGYGCMRWPYKDDSEEIDQEMVNKLVDYALEVGVNYFDTAPRYLKGKSEAVTGIALSRHPRDSYFIATKMSNFDPVSMTPEGSKQMFKESLERLRTDYIDYLLLHSLSGEFDFKKRFLDNGVLAWLLEEKAAGRIRNLGFSFHGDKKGFDYMMSLHEVYHWDFVQIMYNYVDYRHAADRSGAPNSEYLITELQKRGIMAVAMEPLLGGGLSKLPDGIVEKLKQRRPQDSAASWAFRFAGTHTQMMTVLSGMTYMEHLQDNLKTYCGFEPISQEEEAFLDDIAGRIVQFPTVPCTNCKYCMPCPYGLDIPGIFAHYNKCVNEDMMPQSSQDENFRKARKRFLIGYERAVPQERQASHCIACGKCVAKCPQKIKIPNQMQKIDAYVEKLKQEKL